MTRAALLGIVLVALGLRLWGVGELLLWGDSAYSAYTARQSLAEITWGRVGDAHPPLYYYLLHWWIGLAGQTEFSLRLPSVAFGLLTVPLAYATGRRLGGAWVALGAALLVATSPMLVYYSRLPRMYSLAPFLALLSTYLLHHALAGRRRAWLGYFVATLAAVYTHYYALLLVLGQGVYVLMRLRRERHHLGPWLAGHVGLAIAYGPWLLFAARTQAEATAGIISQAPAAPDLVGLAEQIWLPFHSGITLEVMPARLLALPFLAIIVLGLVGWWRGRPLPTIALLLFISFVVALAAADLIFLVLPYAVRSRFFVLWLPGYLVILAWLWSCSHRLHRRLPAVAALAILAANGYALGDAYFVERHIQEPDIVMVTEYLEEVALPGDAVVFHAFWQIGYLTTHFPGEPPAIYSLAQADPAALEAHERVWLSIYGYQVRNPSIGLEEWLDRHWHKAGEIRFGDSRLGLYSRPLVDGPSLSHPGSFLDLEGRPRLHLEQAQMEPGPFIPGQSVRFTLRWQALADGVEPLVFFLHLVDQRGNRLAGRDAEPAWAAEPTSEWKAGQSYEDRPALRLPLDLPPGSYTVVAGLYPRNSGGEPRQPAVGPAASADHTLTLGTIQIQPLPPEAMPIAHRRDADLGPGLRLLGYTTDLDRYAVDSQLKRNPTPGEAMLLSFPRHSYRPGETVEVTLFWQAQRPLEEDYIVSVQLVTEEGQILARDDRPPHFGSYPTYRWPPGDVVVDRRPLPLPSSLPPGEYTLRVAAYPRAKAETRAESDGDSVLLQKVRLRNQAAEGWLGWLAQGVLNSLEEALLLVGDVGLSQGLG